MENQIVEIENNTFTIKKGTIGTYNIKDIQKITLCLEQASFKG